MRASVRTRVRTGDHDTRSAEHSGNAAAAAGPCDDASGAVPGLGRRCRGAILAIPSCSGRLSLRCPPTVRRPPRRRRPATSPSAGRSIRLVLLPLALAAGRLDRRGPPGQRRPPRVARPAPAHGRVPRRAGRDRGRPAVRHRALRHGAVLGPHGPAHPSRRSSPLRCSRLAAPMTLAPPGRVAAGSTTPDPADPPFADPASRFPSRSSPGSCLPASCGATHFSPLFDLALENRLVHDLEHVLFLGWRSCSGGRPSGSDPALGACAIRSA